MALVTFYFQLHQPFRLNPNPEKFLWDEQNRDVFKKVAEKCYLPATRMFAEAIAKYPKFKIAMSMSGTFLEQAEVYNHAVIDALYDLVKAGQANDQVEFLDETYYHSLSGLFQDPAKEEFKEQVSFHRQKMKDLFDVRPKSFRNTELMYNNDIGNIVADMGYKAMLCEQRDDMFTPQSGRPISPHAVFRAKGRRRDSRKLIIMPRNRNLSDDVAFRFAGTRLTADKYAEYLAKVDGEVILLGYDYEHIGEHIWSDTGIFEFWKGLPAALARHEGIVCANPSDVADSFKDAECPVVDIHPLSTSSWADIERNTYGWLGSGTQHALFKQIETMEPDVRRAGGALLRRWRHLTTSDHLYYLHEGRGADRVVHDYFSPYGSLATATYLLTSNLTELRIAARHFNIRKQRVETPVVIISPETARLPEEGMGGLARYVSGKSGGLGEVVSALCKGLSERRLPVHLITLNLKRRFREEARMSEEEWVLHRHKLNPENVHLVSSSRFENYRNAYEGRPVETAAEFQRQIINMYLKEIRGRYDGRGILHTHDWIAGGTVTAYARMRGMPILHTVHNTHTGLIPVDELDGISLGRMWDKLYIGWEFGKECVDSQATAINNATKISYVGKRFLEEIVEDYFPDVPVIPWSVRQETKAKYYHDSALVIPNGISPDLYPENRHEEPDFDKPGLARTYGPEDDVLAAKKVNMAKFQKQMGLAPDPDAILLYWPSRLDPNQKGIELLEFIAQEFVSKNPDVQIAVVGDGLSGEWQHRDIMGRIACASGGRIAYQPFSEELSLLGYAAAHDVFGASLYEPFGQIDVMGNIYGATATNRDTGGYSDKIVPLSLKAWGAPTDRGNGVLFKTYDTGGLWWGLSLTVQNHRFFKKNIGLWERQAKRIMREAREQWSLENMVAGYITAYEDLNGGLPLA
jgi:glycogen synthase